MKKISLKEVQLKLLEAMNDIDCFCKKKSINYYMLCGSVLGAIRHNGFIPWDDDIDIGMYRCDYQQFIDVMYELEGKYIVSYMNKNIPAPIIRICLKDTYICTKKLNKIKKENIYIDIFPLDNVPSDQEKKNVQIKKLNFYKKVLYYKNYCNKAKNIFKNFGKQVIHLTLKLVSNKWLLKKIDVAMRISENENSELVCSMASQYSYEKQSFSKNIYGLPISLPFENKNFLFPQNYELYLTQLYGDYMIEIKRKQNPSTFYILDTGKYK